MTDRAPTSAPVGRARGVAVRLALSVVLAAAFVYVLSPYLQAIPADLSIAPGVLVLYLATLVPYHLLRAGRWLFLLRPLPGADGTLPGLPALLRIGFAGYMWIALLPFRLGEFARPVFVAQRSGVGVSQALGTIAIERAVDGLMVCGLFFVGMAGATATETAHGDASALYLACYGVMAAFTAALLGMLAAARWPEAIAALARRLLAWASPRLAAWAEQTVRGVAEGFRALPDPRALAWFTLSTAGYWLANAAGMWVLARGCGLALGPFEAIATLAVMNLALLVPGGPAQLGVFQTGVALALHLFLTPEDVMAQGSRFAFFLYVCQLSTIVLLGLVSQWTLRLDWRAALGMPSAGADETSKDVSV